MAIEIEALAGKIFSIIGVLTFVQRYLPPQFLEIVNQWLNRVVDYFNLYWHINVPEFKGIHYNNDLYKDAQLYVTSLESAGQARNLTAYRERNANASEVAISPDSEEVIHDTFQGVRICWSQHTIQHVVDKDTMETHAYTLKLNKIDQNLLRAYLTHVSEKAAEMKLRSRELILYTNCRSSSAYGRLWTGIPFNHPSTFDTLALDPSVKEMILDDLDRFKAGKEFCRQIGRPWKRGYLLHGPPGTGKSSLIAAIANYMRYDIYDLELTRVSHNQELRALLTETKKKAIIVIEDIDCSLDLTGDREPNDDDSDSSIIENRFGSEVTLSGLLNFTDGLWSCCGEERIIIFTTNHPEHLDPALLRCGRMDVHIELSYCNFTVFKILAFNYLRIRIHELYPMVEDKIVRGADMTPAEVIEILMSQVENADEAVSEVISALDAKIKGKEAQQSDQAQVQEISIAPAETNPQMYDGQSSENHVTPLETNPPIS